MYKLYKITNIVNKKLYVGITKLSLNQRWAKHLKDSHYPKYPLHRAIKKYGAAHFYIELLHEDPSRTVISDLEEPTILVLNSRKNGYNVAKGGYGGDLGIVANIKRRRTLCNRPLEEKQRLAGLQRQRQLGKTKENDAGRKSQSEKIKGNKFALGHKHSNEIKQKIGAANTFKRSNETRQRMSNSAIINQNGRRFNGRRACCLCCKKDWDIGNFTQHIKRNKNVI